jgi:flavoprotein
VVVDKGQDFGVGSVAPVTDNTVNKLALGIADTYALTVLVEAIGRGVSVVIVPFVNTALAFPRAL